ncbi:MAG: Uma2 family endonuclease [Desulfitobacteriaceae bacterium]
MINLPKPLERSGRIYTYEDYLQWPEDERWEIIDGVAFDMTPAPTSNHQLVLGELLTIFNQYLKGKPCVALVAPFDVRLPRAAESDKKATTVVQPDLTVICDKSKIDRRGCLGSPDLVVEISSPSTFHKDIKTKFKRYEEAEVKEYWIVHPEGKTIVVYRLQDNGSYTAPEVYGVEDLLPVGIFPDLIITLKDVFSVIVEDLI